MGNELPADLIRTRIFPYLPAVDIRRSRVLGKSWNLAYLNEVQKHELSKVQSTRGGQIPLGFLLKTDKDQAAATRGRRILRSFKSLEEAFPGREAKILATSNGLASVYLREPVEFLVTNLIDNVLMDLNRPLQDSESNCVGMAVFPVEGIHVPKYMVIIPYRPQYLNQDVDANPRIRFSIWDSDKRYWLDHPQVIDLENWNTKNVVQIGALVYFHLSENDVAYFDTDEGQPELLDLPLALLEAQGKALCVWKEKLSFFLLQGTMIHIYSLQDDDWNFVHHINLEGYVQNNRYVFRSLAMTLRRRPSETPEQALEGASIVGYAEPDWLLLHQGGSFVLISIDPEINETAKGRPRRINLKNTSGNFFFTHTSSLIRVVD